MLSATSIPPSRNPILHRRRGRRRSNATARRPFGAILNFAIRLFQLEGNRTAVLPGGWSPREGNVKDRVFGIGVDQHVSVDRAVSSAVSIAFTDSLLQNQ